VPGLTGVIGVADARSAAELLAARLHHRPGYTTSLYADAGYAIARIERPPRNEIPTQPGELEPPDTPGLCLVHGSPGTAADGSPATEWISGCLHRDRLHLISQLEGSFHACCTSGEGLALVTDRFGHHPLYITPFQDGFAFSPEVQALTGLPGFDNSLDDLSIRQLLEHGHVFDHRSLYSSVELLPAGTVTTLTPRGARHRSYYCFDPPRMDPDLGPGDLGEAIESAVSSTLQRTGSNDVIGCMLSGGLDSRTIAVEAVNLGLRPVAITFGTADSADVQLATRIAQILDLHHLVFKLDPLSVADSIQEAVLVTGGTTGVAHLTGHASNRLLAAEVDVVLSGMCGDGIMGKVPPDLPSVPQKAIHALPPEASILMPEDFRSTSQQTYGQSLAVDTAAYPDGTPHTIISTFEAMRCRWRRFTLSGVVSRRIDTSVRMPFFDQQLLEKAFSLSPERRRYQAAYVESFKRKHPECAAVPWERTGRPVARGARQPPLPARLARGLRSRISGLLKKGPGNKIGHFDYAAELRQPGPLRDMVVDLLTDGTASERPWLQAKGIQTLLKGHFKGQANHLHPLSRALTLELFLRGVSAHPAQTDGSRRPHV